MAEALASVCAPGTRATPGGSGCWPRARAALAHIASHGADIAIYLDGPVHERPDQRLLDDLIRDRVRDLGFRVLAVPVVLLDDPGMRESWIRRLASLLQGGRKSRQGR